METAVLALFAASLAACLASGLSILWALLLGFILFFACGGTPRGICSSWRGTA